MASGSQRGIRSVELRAGNLIMQVDNTLSILVWKAFLGVGKGKEQHALRRRSVLQYRLGVYYC
jgi:hypothetical protein